MAKKKIKEYKVGLDSETYAISLVEEPAIEENFIYMNKDKEDVMLSSDEKHMVYGAILVPDKPIYRNDGENEYYITFTKESIEKMSKDYMREYRQSNVTVDHEEEVTETTLVESWIKSDLYKDKSVALGLNEQLPVGTWLGGFYVNNVELWEKVKSGDVKGFSVEAMVNLEELNFSKQDSDMVVDDNFWSRLKNTFMEVLNLKNEDKQDETVEEVVETQLEAVEAVVEAPQATETVEVVETPTEPIETPTEPIQSVEEAPSLDEKDGEIVQLKDLLENLKEEVKALREANGGLEAKIKQMSSEPSVKPINVNAKPSASDTYSAWRETMRSMIR